MQPYEECCGDGRHEQSGEADLRLSAHRARDQALADAEAGRFDDAKLARFVGW